VEKLMAYETLNDIPDDFRIGDTLTWTANITGYPPATWTAIYHFVKGGDQQTVTASELNGTHLFTINSDLGFTAGVYSWSLSVTDGTDRHTLRRGRINALVDYGAEINEEGYDDRSHVKIVLDALQAMIEGKASKDQASYSIAGRSLARMDVTVLREWRDDYRAQYSAEIKKERIARGLGHSGKVKVRFVK
jgi:hypothetical protein